MVGKDIVIMSRRELKRLPIIKEVIGKKLKQKAAAIILALSVRQIGRIVKRVRKEGDEGIIHKRRGKPSNRALPATIKEKAIKLYRKKYWDFGPTFANEKLCELEGIKIGDQSLRNWLIEDGAWQLIHKCRKHREWRERKHHFGEMTQMDGSHHDWFEGRGPWCVLMGYIDDAESRAFAKFYKYEGTMPAMDSFKCYTKQNGLPNSVYIDKLPAYKSTAKRSIEDELKNTDPMSHFQRALKELEVRVIYAGSAPAKGRIERLFRTFQDRLVKEMRLRGISNIEEANKFLKKYLPIYNKKFAKKAIKPGNFHRALPKDIDLDRILCKKTDRTLRNDFTIAHDKKLYQILESINAKKVTVEERISGRMFITYKGKYLRYKMIVQRPVREKVSKKSRTPKKAYTPPANHPWKNFKINPYSYHSRSNKERVEEPVLTNA